MDPSNELHQVLQRRRVLLDGGSPSHGAFVPRTSGASTAVPESLRALPRRSWDANEAVSLEIPRQLPRDSAPGVLGPTGTPLRGGLGPPRGSAPGGMERPGLGGSGGATDFRAQRPSNGPSATASFNGVGGGEPGTMRPERRLSDVGLNKAGGELGVPRQSGGGALQAHWTSSEAYHQRRAMPTAAPACADNRALVARLAPGSLTVEPHRNANNLEMRVSALTSRNAMLNEEMEQLKSRYTKDEMPSLSEERNLLLAETDELLAETDRMTAESSELKMQRDEMSAEQRAHGELTAEVRELKSENELGRMRHSELVAELSATANKSREAEQIGIGNVQNLSVENQALASQNQQLSLDVVNFKAKLELAEKERMRRKDELAGLEMAHEANMAQARLATADASSRLQLDAKQLGNALEEVRAERDAALREAEAAKCQAQDSLMLQEQATGLAAQTGEDLRAELDAALFEMHKLREERDDALREAEAARLVPVVAVGPDLSGELDAAMREKERLRAELAEALQEADVARQALAAASFGAQAVPATGSASSEGRLRAVMTSQGVSSDDLKSAIGAVDALVEEAKRELGRKQLSERRAAFEQLGQAMDKADEDLIEAALIVARKAGISVEDIEKAEAKLLGLRSMTDEQKNARTARELETQRKKEAFRLVKQDEAASLKEFIDGLEEGVRWMDWRDYAGRTLWRYATDLRAEHCQPVLAILLDIGAPKENGHASWRAAAAHAERGRSASLISSQNEPNANEEDDLACEDTEASDRIIRQVSGIKPISPAGRASFCLVNHATDAVGDAIKNLQDPSFGLPDSEEPAEADSDRPELSESEIAELRAKAFRAVVQDDAATLEGVLEYVPQDIWTPWQNKAGKDLLTLSEERGSSLAYAALAKAMGMISELKRDSYEEREAVWVFFPGDVQPRRATVIEDTPEEADEVLLEYWDGDDPASRVDRCMVRKMG